MILAADRVGGSASTDAHGALALSTDATVTTVTGYDSAGEDPMGTPRELGVHLRSGQIRW